MKKMLLALVIGILLLPLNVKADEGMWFLMFIERLNHRDMQKLGLQLTADEIYSVNNYSLKDAVVMFNGVCSGEVISKNGLVMTNQHCGYDGIVNISSPENNILEDGFWAKNSSEEKQISGLYVRFFVRMGDCTERILSKVNSEMTELEREKIIRDEIDLITKENNPDGKYTVSVKSFFQGNEYYYFIYQDYNDIRLVGVPPENLAQFGGDVDNWEWPRHAGDFSIYRIYADQNGNPADYSESNLPLNVNRYLPINLKGPQEGDFTMVMGYPARTNRWMPSAAIKQNEKFALPASVEIIKSSLYYMRKYMDISEENKLIYASKYSDFANLRKQREGLIKGLATNKTAASRELQEANFDTWANSKINEEKYGNIIPKINLYYYLTNFKSRHDAYLSLMLSISEFASISTTLGREFMNYLKADDAGKQEMMIDINQQVDDLYKTIIIPAEKDILTAQLKIYATKSLGHKIAPLVEKIGLENNYDYTEYVNQMMDSSIFTSKQKIMNFLKNPSEKVLTNDPLYILSTELYKHLQLKSEEIKNAQQDFFKARRYLVEGMRISKTFPVNYPEANGTMRLSFGKVRALPKDFKNDALINNYTTLEGQVKKHIKGGRDFVLPSKIVELFYKGGKNEYADKDGTLHVNFLTDNDIAEGSSGSPVLNGKGELIGIAFDGNIEAMAGEVIFDADLQRTISVDIRYVLWVIENLSGSKNIVDELTLVK